MSHSYRHTLKWRKHNGEKWFKSHSNRVLRRRVVSAINSDAEIMPILREVSDIWTSPKDSEYPHFAHQPVYQREWPGIWEDAEDTCWCMGKNYWKMRRK